MDHAHYNIPLTWVIEFSPKLKVCNLTPTWCSKKYFETLRCLAVSSVFSNVSNLCPESFGGPLVVSGRRIGRPWSTYTNSLFKGKNVLGFILLYCVAKYSSPHNKLSRGWEKLLQFFYYNPPLFRYCISKKLKGSEVQRRIIHQSFVLLELLIKKQSQFGSKCYNLQLFPVSLYCLRYSKKTLIQLNGDKSQAKKLF